MSEPPSPENSTATATPSTCTSRWPAPCSSRALSGDSISPTRRISPSTRLFTCRSLPHAGAARAHRAPLRERVPAAAAHARAVLRVGPGSPRHARRAAGAGGPARLRRPLAFSRQRSLRLPRLRLGSPDARSPRGGAGPRDGHPHRRGARQGGQRGVPDVDHAPRCGGRRQGPRGMLRALLASRQRRGDLVHRVSLHYTFPPAAGYPLNRCLYRLKSDDAFRERYLADPEATLAEAGLDSDRIAALRALDRDRLIALGAHAYLVFMAGPPPKMAPPSPTLRPVFPPRPA